MTSANLIKDLELLHQNIIDSKFNYASHIEIINKTLTFLKSKKETSAKERRDLQQECSQLDKSVISKRVKDLVQKANSYLMDKVIDIKASRLAKNASEGGDSEEYYYADAQRQLYADEYKMKAVHQLMQRAEVCVTRFNKHLADQASVNKFLKELSYEEVHIQSNVKLWKRYQALLSSVSSQSSNVDEYDWLEDSPNEPIVDTKKEDEYDWLEDPIAKTALKKQIANTTKIDDENDENDGW